MKRLIPLLALLLLVGCTKQRATGAVTIGVFEPQQGLYGETGQDTWRGVKLAHRLRPVAGGKKIELALYDTKSQSMEAANGVSVLSDDGALGINKRHKMRSVPIMRQRGSRANYVTTVEVKS